MQVDDLPGAAPPPDAPREAHGEPDGPGGAPPRSARQGGLAASLRTHLLLKPLDFGGEGLVTRLFRHGEER